MIDYVRIAEAIEYYQHRGYIPVEVPWTADAQYINIVLPPDKFSMYCPQLGQLITTAEQSLLQWANETGRMGKFQTTTPCFRAFEDDELHHPYFIKTELFINDPKQVTSATLHTVLAEAYALLSDYLPVRVIETGENMYDIIDDWYEIELGSYGMRSHPLVGRWIFGTGLAEPRMSHVIRKYRNNGWLSGW